MKCVPAERGIEGGGKLRARGEACTGRSGGGRRQAAATWHSTTPRSAATGMKCLDRGKLGRKQKQMQGLHANQWGQCGGGKRVGKGKVLCVQAADFLRKAGLEGSSYWGSRLLAAGCKAAGCLCIEMKQRAAVGWTMAPAWPRKHPLDRPDKAQPH